MFDRLSTRYIIMFCWIIAFIVLWGILQMSLPDKLLVDNLSNIEESITAEDWDLTNERLDKLKKEWHDNRLAIQISNGSAEVYEFERALGHLKILVKHKDDDSIEYLGLLKEISKNITDVFPGP
ncbi:hypothetical protein JCM16358_06650 [Halanaerocella petrolearia]